jgi:hypothetical protein
MPERSLHLSYYTTELGGLAQIDDQGQPSTSKFLNFLDDLTQVILSARADNNVRSILCQAQRNTLANPTATASNDGIFSR